MDTLAHIKSCFIPRFRAEESLCKLFMTLPIIIVELEQDGNILFVNDSITGTTGFTPEELIGKNWWDIFFPGKLYRQVDDFVAQTATGDVKNFEMTLTAKDGSIITIRWNSLNFYHEDGSLETYILFGTDISPLKNLEDALKLSEERQRQMAEVSFEGLFVHDGKKILNSNSTLLRMFGYDDFNAEFLNDLSVLFTPESWNIFLGHINQLHEVPFEIQGVKRNGTIFPIKVCGKIIKFKGKKIHVAAIQNLSQEKQRESALLYERDLFKTTMATSPIGIVLVNYKGSFTYANNRAMEIMGLQETELSNRNILDADWHYIDCDGNPLEPAQTSFSKVLNTGQPVFNECIGVQQKNGARVFFSVNASPIMENARLTGIVITFDDITSQLHTLKDLRESEERFRLLAESTSEAIIIHEQGNIISANQVAQEMFGYTAEEFARMDSQEKSLVLVCPEYHQEIITHMTTGDISPYEVMARKKNGITFPVRIHGRTIPFEHRMVRVSVFTDLTGQREAESTLRQERDLFSTIMETNPAGIVMNNREGHIIFANRRAEELLGIPTKNLEGLLIQDNAWQILDCDGYPIPPGEHVLERVIRTGQMILDTCYIIDSPDGSRRTVSVSAAPLYRGGELDGVVTIYSDISERIRYEEAMASLYNELAERAKDLAKSNITLSRERDLLSILMETVPMGIVTYDDEGNIIFSNRQAREILNMTQEALIESGDLHNRLGEETPFFKIQDCKGNPAPPEDDIFIRVKSTQQPIYGICQSLVWKDNQKKYFSINGAPIFDENHKLISVITTFDDITDNLKIQIDLQESQERFRMLSDLATEGIIVHDRGRVIMANTAVQRLFGLTREEFLGLDTLDKTTELYTPESLEIVRDHVSSGNEEPYEVEGVKRDGTVFPLRLHGRNIPYGQRMVRVTSYIDLTERRAAEAALRRERDLLSKIMDTSPVGILLFDQSGNIILANKETESILGRPKEEIINQRFNSPIWSSTDCEGNQISMEERVFFKAIRTGEAVLDECRLIEKPDGTQAYVSFNAAPFTSNGQVDGVVVILEDITRRMTAERAVQESQERFQQLAESTTEGIVIHENGQIIDMNKVFCDLFGYTRDEVLSKKYIEFFHPVDERARLQKEITRKSEGTFETVGLRKDGSTFPARITVRNAHFQGRCIRIAAILDLTSIKAAEAALRRERDLLNRIFAISPTGIIIMDNQGNMIFANKSAEEQMGLTKDEITQRAYNSPDWVFTDCEGKPMSEEELGFTIVKNTREPLYNLCEKIQWPDGRQVMLNFSLAPLLDENGEVDMVITTFEDITERTRVEKEMASLNDQLQQRAKALAQSLEYLRREREFLNKVMTTSPMGIILMDKEGNMYFANDYASRMLDISREEITRRTFDDARWEILDCTGKPVLSETMPFARVITTTESVVDFCFSVVTGSGRRITLSLNAAPLLDEKGAVEGVINIFQDITERVQTQRDMENLTRNLEEQTRELQDSNSSLERFAFIASHDLKEPLNVILGYARLLISRYQPTLDSEAGEFLQYIVDDAIRMQKLINGLLTLSHISTRGKPFEPISSEDTVRYALINLEARIEENDARITFDDLPMIYADEAQLTQVFQNLIGNAIKYRKPEEQPRIHISARREENSWLFTVSDNGIGIEKKYFEKIFKIFQHIQKGPESSSSGIGLAIVEKIIKRHGGRIWVESEPGVGSTFFFTIPIRQENRESKTP